MKILLLQSKDLLKPDLGLWIWSVFCITVVLLAVITLIRFLIRYNFPSIKNKNKTKALTLILLLTGMFSCSDEKLKPDNTTELNKLATDYNLRVVPATKADDKNALHFANLSDARTFLEKAKQVENWSTTDGVTDDLVTAYAAGLSSSQYSMLKQYLNSAAKARDGYDGNEGNEAPPGSGYFAQRFFPWSKVYVQMSWDDNGRVTNVQSGLTGLTLGFGLTQLSYTPVLQENGSYIIQISYTITCSIFVEGIGNVYVTDPRIMYAAIIDVNNGGGAGGNFTYLDGTIHSTLAGALDRIQRKQ